MNIYLHTRVQTPHHCSGTNRNITGKWASCGLTSTKTSHSCPGSTAALKSIPRVCVECGGAVRGSLMSSLHSQELSKLTLTQAGLLQGEIRGVSCASMSCSCFYMHRSAVHCRKVRGSKRGQRFHAEGTPPLGRNCHM